MKAFHNFDEVLTLHGAYKKDGRNLIPEDASIIKNASIVIDSQKILWVGATKDIPSQFTKLDSQNTFSMKGFCATPLIIDSHTHTVFSGDRAHEYLMRQNGATYEDIAKSGGGILNTVANTQKATPKELYDLALKRILKMASLGIGTLEIKSGYGLSFDDELKVTKVIHQLKEDLKDKITIVNTCLAAHAIPKGQTADKYLNGTVFPLLKKLTKEKLIDFVDIFHEKGYFDKNHVEKLFSLCEELNIQRKIHADEFQDNKGASLAIEHGCTSCDHLLCTSDEGIQKLAISKTVATLLPGTGYFLGKNQADARKMLDHGVKLAIASDYNPGSCHFPNLLMIATLSAPTFKLNQAELWSAITLNAAHALNLKDRGALIEGLRADIAPFETNSLAHINYSWGENFFHSSIKNFSM